MSDLIDRQAILKHIEKIRQSALMMDDTRRAGIIMQGMHLCEKAVRNQPSAQPEKRTEERAETHACDLIDREAAIDAADRADYTGLAIEDVKKVTDEVVKELKRLPSAQAERTCVNCGRTANNGGWYADGGTRCPIEEHYALPKDGYCHLWEKRNVTDDDYPERREK